jgi:hypothetical protein
MDCSSEIIDTQKDKLTILFMSLKGDVALLVAIKILTLLRKHRSFAILF